MKHIPVRQCMGCRAHIPKRDLIRVVRSPEGAVTLDPTGKARGRGVYLCRSATCNKRIRKTRALERMLKTAVPEEVAAAIEALLAAEPEEPRHTDENTPNREGKGEKP